MIVRNDIWEDLKQAYANAICAGKYATVQRRIGILYKILIPVLSALCVLFSSLKWQDGTTGAAILLFVSSMAKAVFPKIILPDKDIIALDGLNSFFMDYHHKMNELLHQLDYNKIDEDKAIQELRKQKKNMTAKATELNKLILWIPSHVDRKITLETDYHLNAIYNNKY